MTTENKTESLDPQERRRQQELERLFRELRQLEKWEQIIREHQKQESPKG